MRFNLICYVLGFKAENGNPPNGNIQVGGGKETKMGFPE
jgi:hypothetical protein